MLRVLPMLAYLALVVYALVDVVQSDEEDGGGIQKGFWILIILLLPFAGSIAWLVVSRRVRANRGPAPRTGYPAGPVPPAQYPGRRRTWETDETAAAEPDDDPEMRWLLEQARLKHEREQAARDAPRPVDDEGRTAAG
ncbi:MULTISPECIES: PLD nuclease N-terminal domain-containing protein [unclassified Isoptericola]|uniref:PLD nuclease N-terminal domain-containing protein n=1 Tax=unclassified Isoptericola TaxID=2623355 RepID=UPI0037AC8AE6|nr:PLDc_N domain-containing protein [Isoptericola sp. QY 916]